MMLSKKLRRGREIKCGKIKHSKARKFFNFFFSQKQKKTTFELIINQKKGQPILAHDTFIYYKMNVYHAKLI